MEYEPLHLMAIVVRVQIANLTHRRLCSAVHSLALKLLSRSKLNLIPFDHLQQSWNGPEASHAIVGDLNPVSRLVGEWLQYGIIDPGRDFPWLNALRFHGSASSSFLLRDIKCDWLPRTLHETSLEIGSS